MILQCQRTWKSKQSALHGPEPLPDIAMAPRLTDLLVKAETALGELRMACEMELARRRKLHSQAVEKVS